MTRPHTRYDLGLEALLGRLHLGGPFHVVLVLDHHRDGAADGEAAAHAADDSGDVGLDLLPATAPMAALPPGEVATKILFGDLETGRQAFDHDRELGSVRLPGSQPPEH